MPELTRADVVAAARAWIGTQWVHQHRTQGVAVDCGGLVIGVARQLGIVPACFDVNGYERYPDGSLVRLCSKYMDAVSKADMRPGDVLVVAVDKEPQHLGILGDYRHGGLSLIHAALHRGVVESRLMFARNMQFCGAFALPGVA